MRYVLPAFPFVFIWISQVAVVFGWRHWRITSIASAALAWSIIGSLWVYPHSLSYFNELVGGPSKGPGHLISSNVDWGQDLLVLRQWLNHHPEARPLKLAYFGYLDPRYAGIDYTAPDDMLIKKKGDSTVRISPGWYVISVNFVRGFPYSVFKGDGSRMNLSQDALASFQQFQPVAMAGYSIYIYHITLEEADHAGQQHAAVRDRTAAPSRVY
jgi:hypothetical protein